MSFLSNVAAEMSPPFMLALACYPVSQERGSLAVTVCCSSCLAVQPLQLKPTFLKNPSSWPLCCSSSCCGCGGWKGGFGEHIELGGGLHGGTSAWAVRLSQPSPRRSANPGKQPVLAGQSLSILVKVSEVLPGYLFVDCLKYQRVSLPLCSHAFQPCRAAALLSCIGRVSFVGLLWHLSIFGWQTNTLPVLNELCLDL